MPSKKKIEVPLANKALEFIQVSFKENKKVYKLFIHYSRVQFQEKDVHVIDLGPILETHKQITELILKIGII